MDELNIVDLTKRFELLEKANAVTKLKVENEELHLDIIEKKLDFILASLDKKKAKAEPDSMFG